MKGVLERICYVRGGERGAGQPNTAATCDTTGLVVIRLRRAAKHGCDLRHCRALVFELVDTIDVCFDRGCNDVGV